MSIEALRWLGAWSIHGPTGKPLKKASHKSLAEQQTSLTQGATIAATWPHTFEEALRQHRQPSEPHEVQRLSQAWPGLPIQISRLKDISWREEIWQAVNRVVECSHQSLHPIVGRNPRLTRRAKTQREVADSLGIGVVRLQASLRKVSYEVSVSQMQSGRVRRVVTPEAENALRQELVAWLSVREGAMILGCGRVRVAEMAKSGLIDSSEGRLNRSSVQSVHDQFLACAKEMKVSVPTTPLEHVWRFHVPRQMTCQFLEAVYQGRVRTYYASDTQRWHVVQVNSEDLESWRSAKQNPPDGTLSLHEAAIALGVKEQVAYELANRGLLSTVSLRRVGRRVTQEAINRFLLQYCSLIQLTREHGVQSHHALNWAHAQGFNVVTGPRIDGSRQYFVRR